MTLVGKKAPDFKLVVAPGNGSDNFQVKSLKDFAGKWLAIMFYPRDFTFV